jgi:hypothetical protein
MDGDELDIYMAEQLEKAREEEREQCCRDVCWMCGKSERLFLGDDGVYKHQIKEKYSTIDVYCRADPIRQRADGNKNK